MHRRDRPRPTAPPRNRLSRCPRLLKTARSPEKTPRRQRPPSQLVWMRRRSRLQASPHSQLRRRHPVEPRHQRQRPTPGSFAVQLGTFGSRENANRLVRDMTAKGFAAFVAPYSKEGHELYRVRVGPTRDRAGAEALAAQLRRIGQSGSIVPIS